MIGHSILTTFQFVSIGVTSVVPSQLADVEVEVEVEEGFVEIVGSTAQIGCAFVAHRTSSSHSLIAIARFGNSFATVSPLQPDW